jgi:geranylgeranyl reductase family protein
LKTLKFTNCSFPNEFGDLFLIYDAAIIGAGPAGASCAYALEKAGYNIIIIDKEKFPRPKPCAGVLPPRIFSELDVPEDISERPLSGYRIIIVRREKFDDFLVSRLNTELKLDRATDFSLDADSAVVDCINESFKARIVIGCDGVHSAMRKVMDKTGMKDGPLSMALALQYEISLPKEVIDERSGNWFEVFYTIPYGYGWISPLKDALKVGIGGISDELKKNSKNCLEDFLKHPKITERIAGGENVGTEAHLIPMQGPFHILTGERLLLCGDAGGFVFPGTGEGVYYALKSGRIAAEVVEHAFKEGRFDTEFLAGSYNEKLEKNGLTALRDVDFVNKVLSSPENADKYIKRLKKLTLN